MLNENKHNHLVDRGFKNLQPPVTTLVPIEVPTSKLCEI